MGRIKWMSMIIQVSTLSQQAVPPLIYPITLVEYIFLKWHMGIRPKSIG